ncbi:MAG: protein kinase [Gammaproteobacteria bacterium]
MADIRQTLTDVLSGAQPPEAFLTAVDEFLARPNANIAALRSLIDAAEKNGLPKATADAARAKLVSNNDVVDIGDPTRAVEEDDDNPDRTVLTGDEDAETQLRADPADIDRTVFTGGDTSDKTEFTGGPDSDKTEITGAGADDKTVATGDDDATVQVGGDDPFAMTGGAAAQPDELGPGSVLKGRFRLEQVIGQGGMGAVYKAVDLLKVEARDRNPYMAVKLLVGDFKEHPEAFIALQRESAKAQRLAHPNIATVYDFDRDGETVYMTMELMVGAELAQYIKKLPKGGLPVPEATRIIEQLCAGLQYAHARGLVHSDFKPGNAFLLDDGTVKLLDFGIARASKTKADAEGESTVFDPGQLGALTPAYATIEMFEGQDPDPRDDIYALAAVSYELFTGKHPFNKMSAVKAKEKSLKPAPIEKLTKRQNKTLIKALALHRDDRTGSVEEFWEGIKPRKDYTLHIAAGATAAALLLGALLYNPIVDLIHQREHNAIVMEIDSGDTARLEAALEQINQLPPERQRDVASLAADPIIAYFENRAEAAIDESAGRYDYAIALAEIDKLDQYFPDSNTVGEIRRDIIQRRELLLSELRGRFETALTAGNMLPNPDADDLTDIVPVLRAAAPDDELLRSVNAINAYQNLADTAIRASQWERAQLVLATGLAYVPDDPGLLDKRAAVQSELRRQEEAELIASLRTSLQQTRPRTLAEFRAVNADLQRLGELDPEDTVVRGLDNALVQAVGGTIDDAAAAGNWDEANAILAEFARALPMAALISQRLELNAAQTAAGFDAPTADVGERIASIRTSLSGAAFDESFARELTGQFKELTARVGRDTAAWDALREDIVQAHIAHANTLIEQDRYSAATTTLAQAQPFHPDLPALAATAERLVTAEQVYRAAQAELARLQEISTAKARVTSAATAGRADEALREFNVLKNQLPADDPFITEVGPNALAEMYATLAADNADAPATAANFIRAGLQVLPDSEQLRELLAEYQSQAARAALVEAASGLSIGGVAAFRRDYAAARQGLSGADGAAFERDVVGALIGRLNVLERTREGATLRAAIVDLFAGGQRQRLTALSLREPEQPSVHAPRITQAMNAGRLTEAEQLLVAANRAEPGHTQLAGFGAEITRRKNQADQHYRRAREQQANRNVATEAIREALAIWSDNETYSEFSRTLVGTIASTGDDGSRPCTPAHAEQGRRPNGRCYDVVAPRVPAPSLVVVPAPAGGTMFAISRQEITVEDFNKFCSATDNCQPMSGDSAMPVTGVTIQSADAYVAWLSEVTGKAYRIPTSAEWTHAAGANGNPGVAGNYNCTVLTPSGTKQKGHAVQRATAGEQNGWGLLNALGNVQEWARNGGTLQAHGASHDDSLSDCRVAFARPHSGTADAMTGFRIVRHGGIE